MNDEWVDDDTCRQCGDDGIYEDGLCEECVASNRQEDPQPPSTVGAPEARPVGEGGVPK